MSVFTKVKHIPYDDSQQCMMALTTIEAIDYFFARQIFVSQQQSATPLNSDPKSGSISERIGEKTSEIISETTIETVSETSNGISAEISADINCEKHAQVFHVLLALSQFQRRGSVCISLTALANTRFWQEDSDGIRKISMNTDLSSSQYSQRLLAKPGFTFTNEKNLSLWVTQFMEDLAHNTYLVFTNNHLYSKRYWHYEYTLCHYIARSLQNSTVEAKHRELMSKQAEIVKIMELLFSTPLIKNCTPDLQQLAVLNSLRLPFSIITGGAGTGKTYTITRLAILISLINNVPIHAIEMAAPTGKAANRMAESLQEELAKLAKIPQLTQICDDFSELQPKTINRLLKTKPATGQSAYSALRPLPAKLVIVDETSMIDISLMNKLIESLAPGTQLILVGDPNQLPSVETGCLLADLVAHPFGQFSQAHWQSLCAIYPALRDADTFAAQHLIGEKIIDDQGIGHKSDGKAVVNKLVGTQRSHQRIDQFAKAVLTSDTETAFGLAYSPYKDRDISEDETSLSSSVNDNSDNKFDDQLSLDKQEADISKGSELTIIPPASERSAKDKNPRDFTVKRDITKLIAQHILPNFFELCKAQSPEDGFLALKKYALLTPFKQSYFGTESLNQMIEQLLSAKFSWIKPKGLYPCKPIMILQNDYQLSLFNGDIGFIWQNDNNELMAYFSLNKKLVGYPVYNLPAFDTNYAMTIHKTQGSEFESVDIILPSSKGDFLNKQLLYTAVTRAQKRVRIFSSQQTLTQTLHNSADRISGIDTSLRLAFEAYDVDKLGVNL